MRVSVKTSLIAAVAILVAFLFSEGFMAASKLGVMRDAANDLSGTWMPSMRLLSEIKYTVTRHRVQTSRMVINDDEAVLREMEGRLANTVKTLDGLFGRYER